ncbi:recombinase family protein [Caballeronia sp. LP003]|uniref:recombinase family protein n=1 Tax=Caballeronia sp. LP003 TaxID=3038551 RepID=UPI00286192D5|nr:recombinase family protein [Caballeronia sp. LP003]MDR5790319.1 recombinase family protein [Caballeronia sp. LP003]
MAKRRVGQAPVALPTRPPRLFIYGRFSSKKQASGNSYERQMLFAHEWAKEHGYEIDDEKTMFDYGVSAFRGAHREFGALAAFFKAMQKGDVLPGDVLLVESLDRLSREKELDAFDQFKTIVQAGVTIFSMQDGEFSLKKIEETQGGILHYALAIFTRAHNESKTKSERVLKAAHAICCAWRDDDWGKRKRRKPISIGKDPSWVRWNDETERFEPIPEQVELVLALIGFFLAGHSPKRCFEQMKLAGIALPKGISNTSRVHRVLADRALVGEKFIEFDEDKQVEMLPGWELQYTIPNYYPAILTEDEFSSLTYLREQKGRRVGKAEVVSIMTGMRMTKCAMCNRAIGNQNIMSRSRREDGLPQDGHRRLKCTGESAAENPCTVPSCSIVPVERALMEFCSDQMNLAALFTDNDEKAKLLSAQHAHARREADAARDERDLYLRIGAVSDSKTAGADVIRARIDQLSAAVKKWTDDATRYEHDLATLHRHSTPAVAEEWAKLREGVRLLDTDARMKARILVADTFKQIDVDLSHVELVSLRLVSKRDVVRVLTIDRKTGERLDQMTIADPHHEALTRRPKKKKIREAA